MRYEVYELQVRDRTGRQVRALAEFRPDADTGTVRSAWDDTKAAAWNGEFGWVPLLPNEAFEVHRVDLRGATRRSDLTDAVAARTTA
jgi:hypothetical protein